MSQHDTADGNPEAPVITQNGVEHSQPNTYNQRQFVSGSQSFILGAVIHTTNKMLPYQTAMVENYLQVSSFSGLLNFMFESILLDLHSFVI